MRALKICSLNINGIRDRTSTNKANTLIHNFDNLKEDIICFVDTRLDTTLENKITSRWKGQTIFAHNTNNHTAGIAILIRDNSIPVNSVSRDPLGRYLIFQTEIQDKKLLIASIYASATSAVERKSLFNVLKTKIQSLMTPEHALFILGDFNMTEKPSSDKSSANKRIDPSLQNLKSLKHTLQVEDIWRIKHPNKTQFSFQSARGDCSRIDRIYASRSARGRITQAKIVPCVHSDHDSVHIQFKLTDIETGKGSWVLNQSVLEDPKFYEAISAFWRDWQLQKNLHLNLADWWDEGKRQIKTISQNFCRTKNLGEKRQISSLNKRIRNAAKKAENGNPNAENLKIQFNTQLKELEEKRAQAHILRAKAQWTEEGERCTKYFLNLENKKKNDTTIRKLQKSDGSYATNTADILSEMYSFYKQLYTASPTNIHSQNHLLTNVTQTLTNIQQSFCEGLLSFKEVTEAMKKLNNGKSPGTDGLPVEFYNRFWDIIGKDLTETLNSCYKSQIMSQSQREAVIKCLPKKGDTTKITNWRPVSLLNVDYKIMTRALADRISKVLPFIIDSDQTCNVKGRTIHNNTAVLRDIIDYANDKNIEAYLLSIDQMKAFDRVDWNFMFRTLKKFNFGESFIQWIKLAYNQITSKIKVNGTESDSFTLERGVRQGCPLSAMLYIVTAEILALTIRANNKIVGISVDGTEFKLSQYADDTTLMLSGEESLDALINTLCQYEQASGAKVHPGKCAGLWLGSNRGRIDAPYGYTWSNTHIKILGMYFGHGDLADINWKPRVDSYIKTLNIWQQRDLSMKGKTIILNQLAASKLVYTAHTYPCKGSVRQYKLQKANNFLQLIHKHTWAFFWSGKGTRIDQETISLSVEEGGMAVADITKKLSAIRLTTISNLYNPEKPGKWKILAQYQLNKIRWYNAGKNIFKTILTTSFPAEWGVSPFYRRLISDWINLTENRRPQPETLEGIMQEPIFHNQFIAKPQELTGRPQPLTLPNWFHTIPSNTLHTISNLCYECVPGFHSIEQIRELTHYQMKTLYLTSVQQSIPKQWETKIKQEDSIPNTENQLFIFNKNKPTNITQLSSKSFYTQLHSGTLENLKIKKCTTHFYTDWERKTGPVKWSKIFKFMHRNHTNKHITDIQFKLIHFGIATRKRLFERKSHTFPQTSPVCTRCNLQDEDGEHIFVICTESEPVWRQVEILIARVIPGIPVNKHKHIVTGYADSGIPQTYLELVEDIRICFFQAIWTTRNKSLYEQIKVTPLIIFKSTLQSLIKNKYHKAVCSNNENSFLTRYGNNKIFEIRNSQLRIL